MTVDRDVELANQIGLLLADEAPDNQILALMICILRLKLHGAQRRACPDGQALVDRFIAAIGDGKKEEARP
jgi:hypothetical protein